MKKSILFACLLLIAGAVQAQAKDSLVLDETTWTDTKNGIRIDTWNDSIYRHMLDENYHDIVHVNWTKKGNIYTFYFKSDYKEQLLKWIARFDALTIKKRKK